MRVLRVQVRGLGVVELVQRLVLCVDSNDPTSASGPGGVLRSDSTGGATVDRPGSNHVRPQ